MSIMLCTYFVVWCRFNSFNSFWKIKTDSSFTRLFSKVFSTFNSNIVAYCQYYTGHLPLQYIIDLRCFKFLSNLVSIENIILNVLFSLNGTTTIGTISTRYNMVNINGAVNYLKYCMWKQFVIDSHLNLWHLWLSVCLLFFAFLVKVYRLWWTKIYIYI